MIAKKIVTIVGARPQFIKAAVVSRAIENRTTLSEILVHTGQHYDRNMSDVFFRELGIPEPDINLGIGSSTHGRQTGQMLEHIEQVLLDEQPDWVLVYGDTNSTLAGAIAAAKLHIPIAHVEAGLRSFNRSMPEEINRILTDRISTLLFAPTEAAVENLKREGINSSEIEMVGDVMYDAALYYTDKAKAESQILERLQLQSQSYVLATIHRAENTDDLTRLQAIFKGLVELSRSISVVLPLHPRTRGALEHENLLERVREQLHVIEPVGYLDMILLEQNARLIVTDSGGVQKEAFFHRVPCVTLRTETEWVELINLGWNNLIDPNDSRDVGARLQQFLYHPKPQSNSSELYGGGCAGDRIVSRLQAQS